MNISQHLQQTPNTIFDLLHKGEIHIADSKPYNDIVLLLGVTGSAKTTLSLFITDHDNLLTSKETTENSGEYIIVDMNDKVSNNSTLSSKTVFPELIVDVKTGTAFYDCPGFSDTRTVANDVAGTYFIKRILDSATKVKFVFVVSHSSVRHGLDRHQFPLLIKQALSMIKNLDNFTESMAMVVTKVENQYKKKGKSLILISDEDIIQNISNFLRHVSQELQIKQSSFNISDSEYEFNRRAVKFVNIFLSQDESKNFVKIGIVRRPDEAGSIENIDLLQNNKKNLRNIIHKNTHYSAVSEDDFDYTISADSYIYLNDLVETINNDITLCMSEISTKMHTNFMLIENNYKLNIEKLWQQMNMGYEIMSAYIQDMTTNSYEISEFLTHTITHLNGLQYRLPPKYFKRFYNNEKYLLFIKQFNHRQNNQSRIWANELYNLKNYFKISKEWYNFLIDLETVLSSYEIQRDMHSFSRVANDLTNQLSSNERANSYVLENLQRFLKEINKYGTRISWSSTKSNDINKAKLRILKELINLSVEHELEIFCDYENKKLTVRGKYIKMSNVININCPSAEIYNIFAVKTIFLDTNFTADGKKLQLSIIAPKWETINNVTIMLDGKDGEPHDPQKANDGTFLGEHGVHGKPGKPGGSAGNFFGVGEIFKNHNQLFISANGGVGGPGQSGGDGAAAKDRDLISTDYFSRVQNLCDESIKILFPNCKIHTVSEKSKYTPDFILVGFTSIIIETDVECPPDRKSDGGDGGDGGRGGNGGTIIFIPLNNEEIKLSTSAKQHRNGMPGIGGKGKTGKGTATRIQSKNTVPNKNLYDKPNFFEFIKILKKEFQGGVDKGTDGVTGKNINEIKDDEDSIDFLESPSLVINNYKIFLRENMNDIVGSQVQNFSTKLEKNIKVNSLYNTLSLIDDLQSLESQTYRMRNEINVVQYYECLLQRITLYAENPMPQESSDEYKKILSYLYAATLSGKRHNMKVKFTSFIVDIDQYLDATINDINDLQVLNNVITINKYRENYKKEAYKAIEEAEYFITMQLSPKIDNLCEQIDRNLGLLIESLKSLLEEEYVNKRKLMAKQKILEQYLISKKYLSIINVFSSFLQFLLPVGIIIKLVTDTSSHVVESLMFEKMEKMNDDIDNKLSVPIKKIKSRGITLSNQLKERSRLLAEQLHDVKVKFENELLHTTYSQYFETKENEVTNSTNFSDSKSLSDHLALCNTIREDALKFIKIESDNVRESSTEDSTKKKKLLAKAEQVLSIIDIPVDTYKKIRTHEKEIETLAKSVNKAQSKIVKINDLKKSVFDDIAPIFNMIKNAVTSMEKNLNHKQRWVLDTKRWQISSTLRALKSRIKKIAKEVNLEIDDIIAVSDDLEDSAFILIKMFDTIDEYHEKNGLADYIANVNSPKAIDITIADKKLKDSLDTLKFITQSNMILEKYEILTHAFKQNVFPFVNYNCEGTAIPQQYNNTIDLISQATTNIRRFKSCLTYSGATISQYDHLMHSDALFKNTNRAQPFFIWEWNKHKVAINDLLEGKEVMLKSHINNYVNSVKFNEIGICLKSTNTATQRLLEMELQNYSVIMTHLGNSHYKCDEKVFVIPSEKLIFSYDYYNCSSENVNQQLMNKNLVYDKINNNVPLLSPYATWSLKLVHKNLDSNNLIKYSNLPINIDLEGRGSYVLIDQNNELCQQNLEHYYAEYETVENDDYMEEDKVCHSRRRRQVDWSTNLPVDKLTFTKSAANTIHRSFFINAIVNKIQQWFNFYDCEKVIQHDYNNEIILTNIFKTTPNIHQSTNIGNFLNVNNVLFFDYVIRRKSANKNKRIIQFRNITSHYDPLPAQAMAYNYYV